MYPCTVVIQEESGDDSSKYSATSAMGRLSTSANYSTVMKKEFHHVECDSGYVYSSPDKMPTDVFEPPSSPTPGSLLRPAAVVSPVLLNNGANVNFIPEGPQQSDGEDTATNAPILTSSESDTTDTAAPIPTSSGSVNTEARQPRLDAAENPSSSVAFTIGSSSEAAEAENDEIGEQVATTSVPVTENMHLSQSDQEIAAKFLSSDMVNKLRQTNELIKQNEKLKQQLKEEVDAKEAIRQQKEQLTDQFTQYQKTAMEKEEAAKTKLEQMERQLEKCKEKMSEMELEHKKICIALEEEIASLKQEIDAEKKKNELEMLRLENKLYKAEKELSDKENVILVKEKEIEKLDKKIALDTKDAEIQKLKKENRALRKGHSLSRSLSSLRVSEDDDCADTD